jgi:indole-3-glycerol phosphate synthase
MIGVNNRHLGSFHTDVDVSFRMAESLPKGCVWVSESGISDPATVQKLRRCGYRGFLIGETFMKSGRPDVALADFIRALS